MKTNQTIRPCDIKGHKSWLSVVKCYLKCQKVMNIKLAKLGLTTAQHELLMNINHKPGMSQQEISDRLLVVKSNTSALLKKLQQRGLIERRKDQQDARVHHLHLTSAGEQLLNQSMSVQIEVVQAMTAVMSEDEIQTNLEIMNRVYHSLDQLP
ncbi:MarR family winged helix-turn-helix transcriptional regulator [Marinicella litoralis]|uniref:DNA-binding MarR family transcriptional regulator n=2 Tax=Marinicella litoralis TaxID=644220 RepID=A0A4R6XTK7_9GAMM|nr:MarR family transcriptional regulator [Marinicella litoralis]TDR23292.1 DNA-binding MarR family transcriptional regulator [Marinicella litoralis]